MSDSLFDLRDRVALVTGASSGLGRHFARTLAGRGARVALAARRMERLEELAAELRESGAEAFPVALDVSRPDSVESAVAAVTAQLGGIDVLVNNAGIAAPAAFLELGEEAWRRTMGVNLDGVYRVARAVARGMVERGSGGKIVNVGSIAGQRVAVGLSAYAASKAAVLHLTRAMAVELARYDIQVNALAPGYILTDINREFFESEAGAAMIRRIPQRRIGAPEHLDGALLMLCSGASDYMTGSVIAVDGGHRQGGL